jgi:SAM-dependent methyltransferase
MSPEFSSAAELYDELYAWKDYAAESARIRQILVAEGLHWEHRILEGACGSGRYLEHLAHHFDVTGFDLDTSILEEARERLPKRVRLFEADLCALELPTAGGEVLAPFDCFLLLFGGLGYVPLEGLSDALKGIARALRPGALFICEPWLSPEEFVDGEPHMLVVDRPELKICRQVVTRVEGRKSILDYWVLVSRPGRPTQVLRDTNELYLSTQLELFDALAESGFMLEQTLPGFMEGRELLVCRRR